MFQPRVETTITEITRRAILDYISVERVDWSGRLDEPGFLARLWDLDALPSTDGRYSTAARDIWQHRINNYDWPDDWVFTDHRFNVLRGSDEQFLRFLAEMVHPAVRPDEDEVRRLVDEFNRHLRRDNWELAEVKRLSGHPIIEGRHRDAFHAAETAVAVEEYEDLLDPDTLREHLDRIDRDLTSDPPGAIASSKELVESVLKSILDEAEVTYKRGDDLMTLYKLVQKELALSAEAVPESKRGSEAAVRTLRALVTTIQSLGELRNELGLGHGRTQRSPALTRHARLAFNTAVAVTEFLLETWRHQRA